MSVNRYGKSSSSLINQKKTFFEENERHVKTQLENILNYKKQPKRIVCKNCDKKLSLSADFFKNDVGYFLCDHCSHLNGQYEDTEEFCKTLYSKNSGKEYAENYKSETIESYNFRTASIYIPKAEFLYTSLLEHDCSPSDFKYFDFGAGSGYFVSALKKIGIENVSGTEVSQSQVEFGNSILGENLLSTHNVNDTLAVLNKTKSQVVSMIGVLEHLQNPREVLNELRNNEYIKYIYISVPTFSLSVYLEIISPEVFHRQLGGAHTHLYTEKSLSYICNEFGFDKIGEWWFGTDIVDLFRHISIKLEKNESSRKLQELWSQDFNPIIDSIQLELDKKHFSSEVHMVLKKRVSEK